MEIISKYDISFLYINKNYTEITNEEKIKVINAVNIALINGAVAEDLITKINSNRDLSKSPFTFFKTTSKGNLLNPDKFYYHNELRKYPKPPTRVWDIDTGEIKEEVQEYFLEMKASYTVDDVAHYILKKESLSKTLNDRSRAIGSINFLLKKYDIDYLLFLFDTVNDIYSSKQKYARSLIEASEFEDEAKVNYESKVTASRISGQDKIVVKKRTLFNV